ncbi:MAG: hypothetical protein AAGC81_17610 [Pseudomonadota bacterium]
MGTAPAWWQGDDTLVLSPEDSISDINAAIASAEVGSVLRFEAGTYELDETLVVSRSDITLVGAGQGETIFQMSQSLGDDPGIQVGAPLYRVPQSGTYQLDEQAVAGATSIELDGHDLQVGDTLWIERANTDAFLDEIGDDAWRGDKPLRTNLVEVTGTSGGTVFVDRPLTFDYVPSETTVTQLDLVENVSLSGFSVQGAYGEADPGTFQNTVSVAHRQPTISVVGTDEVSLSDITVEQPASHGFLFAKTLDLTASNLHTEGAHNKGGGGNGYSFWIRDVYDSSFTDLSAFDARHTIVMASYTSAANNFIHVSDTNRDINFHGGRDTGNVVVTDRSVRNAQEQAYMAWVAFVNSGESYGAPTDPDANTIVFREVVGTSKGDWVVAHADGAVIDGVGGADDIHGGAGNDSLIGGAGNDTIVGSAGQDTVDGGSGTDVLVLRYRADEAGVVDLGGGFRITTPDGTVDLTGIEVVRFDDAALDAEDLVSELGAPSESPVEPDPVNDPAPAPDPADDPGTEPDPAPSPEPDPAPAPDDDDDGSGTGRLPPLLLTEYERISTIEEVSGGAGWERETVSHSTVMGDQLDALSLADVQGAHVYGNDLDNNILADSGDNLVLGAGGDDRIFGRHGNDTLDGGAGSNYLKGDKGDDYLIASAGSNTLAGGTGEDVFAVGAGSRAVIEDFAPSEDWLLFHETPLAPRDIAVQAVLSDGENAVMIALEAGTEVILEGLTLEDVGEIDILTTSDTPPLLTDGDLVSDDTESPAPEPEPDPTNDPADEQDGDVSTDVEPDTETGTGDSDVADAGPDEDDDDFTWSALYDPDRLPPLILTPEMAVDETVDLDGGTGWERKETEVSVTMGPSLDAVYAEGDNDLDVQGNALDNNILANGGSNVILGDAGDDRIFARGGDDRVDGGSGDDFLHGGRGDDLLAGGDGDDTLLGERGEDVFLIQIESGHDIIEDFELGTDWLVLDQLAPSAVMAALSSAVSTGEGGTVLSISANSSIELVGVSIDDLDAVDILLAG